jgi:hypothetical protein
MVQIHRRSTCEITGNLALFPGQASLTAGRNVEKPRQDKQARLTQEYIKMGPPIVTSRN